MSEQLKPCPFCGGKAVKCDYQHENGGDYYFIKCDECESRSDEWGSITQAIQNWNTRLIEDVLRTENEVLKVRVVELEKERDNWFKTSERYSKALLRCKEQADSARRKLSGHICEAVQACQAISDKVKKALQGSE